MSLREADGSVVDILVMATDVTEDVRARRAAEAVSAEFEAMFNSLPDGAFLVGPTGTRRANLAGLALLGVEAFAQLQRSPDEMGRLFAVREGATSAVGAPGRTSSARALTGEIVREEHSIRHLSTGRDVRPRTIASPSASAGPSPARW